DSFLPLLESMVDQKLFAALAADVLAFDSSTMATISSRLLSSFSFEAVLVSLDPALSFNLEPFLLAFGPNQSVDSGSGSGWSLRSFGGVGTAGGGGGTS